MEQWGAQKNTFECMTYHSLSVCDPNSNRKMVKITHKNVHVSRFNTQSSKGEIINREHVIFIFSTHTTHYFLQPFCGAAQLETLWITEKARLQRNLQLN
jgi:hypothetical protein